jgi:hypothetical protein
MLGLNYKKSLIILGLNHMIVTLKTLLHQTFTLWTSWTWYESLVVMKDTKRQIIKRTLSFQLVPTCTKNWVQGWKFDPIVFTNMILHV